MTRLSLIIILALGLGACNSNININDYINKKAPIILQISKEDTITKFTSSEKIEIKVDSDKYKKIIQWSNENTSGWRWTPASYLSDISISQDNLRLLYWKGGVNVVIRFTDKENKPQQYSKTIKKGELDFLIEQQ